MREVGILPIAKTLVGQSKPQALAMFAWADAEASHKVRDSNHYKEHLKPLQEEGWLHLAAADVDLKQDEQYQLNIESTYTLAEVWIKDESMYEKYYQATQDLRHQMGAKVIFKHRPNEYNSLDSTLVSPTFVILVEWPNKQDPMRYIQSDEFKKYQSYIDSSISKLNWYELGFWESSL
jgi:uncharacterized protein (DUF1330 family)